MLYRAVVLLALLRHAGAVPAKPQFGQQATVTQSTGEGVGPPQQGAMVPTTGQQTVTQQAGVSVGGMTSRSGQQQTDSMRAAMDSPGATVSDGDVPATNGLQQSSAQPNMQGGSMVPTTGDEGFAPTTGVAPQAPSGGQIGSINPPGVGGNMTDAGGGAVNPMSGGTMSQAGPGFVDGCDCSWAESGSCNPSNQDGSECFTKCCEGIAVAEDTSEPVTPRGPNGERMNIEADESCCLWASQGECSKNEQFMLASCDAACHAGCPQDAGKAAANSGGGPRVDLDERCCEWSEQGECGKNPTFMQVTCDSACHAGCPGVVWEDGQRKDKAGAAAGAPAPGGELPAGSMPPDVNAGELPAGQMPPDVNAQAPQQAPAQQAPAQQAPQQPSFATPGAPTGPPGSGRK